MILSLHAQAGLFLLTIVLGGTLGLLYDCLRILRRIVPHKRLWIQLEDGLFWVCALFLAFGVMLHANGGEIRFFSLLGMFLGMLLYFLTVSRLVIAVSDRVIYAIKWVLRLFFTILFTPFRLLFLLFRRPIEKIGIFCGKQKKKMLHLCNNYVKIKINILRRDWRMVRKNKRKSREVSHENKKEKRKKTG